MYYLNKLAGSLTNPVFMAWIGVVFSVLCYCLRAKRLAHWALVVSIILAWFWSTPAASRLVGVPLERPYLSKGCVPALEDYPSANAIVLHGGSMGMATNIHARGEMWGSADRVWMAARLLKAGSAPVVYVTGPGVRETTVGLLEDFEVPTNAVMFIEEPRNTEEEVKAVARMFNCSDCSIAGKKSRVLVVTSAWHMKRTILMYEKYAPNVEAIPAPCDFENVVKNSGCISVADFLPDQFALALNCIALHEWVGIVGYKLFRR